MANFYDRVLETTTTTGTGNISLAGAPANYVTFGSVLSNGSTCHYTIVDSTNNTWECGLGTYNTSGNTLSRTTVTASTSASSLVNFGSGTKQVFVSPTGSFLSTLPQTSVSNTFTAPQTLKTPITVGNLTSEDPVITWTPVSAQTGIRLRSGTTEVARFQDNGQAVFGSFGTQGGFNIFDFGIRRGGGDGFVQFDGAGQPAVRIGGSTGGNYTSTVRVEGTTTTVPVLAVRGAAGQTADLQQWQNSAGTTLTSITANGGIAPASMTDSSAANGTIYFSSTANRLVFKDSSGVVNNLY
jgi:hypothetical protein